MAYTPPHRGAGAVYHEVPAAVRQSTFGRRFAFPRLLDAAWVSEFVALIVSVSSKGKSTPAPGAAEAPPAPAAAQEPAAPPPSDELRVELLRLMDAVLVHAACEVHYHRRRLVHFAWELLKSQDLNVRQHAFVAMARYLQVFGDSPTRYMQQVMAALLNETLKLNFDLIDGDFLGNVLLSEFGDPAVFATRIALSLSDH